MDYFAFIYRPGPAWLLGQSMLQQPLARHFAYMEKLEQDGVLCLGGPFEDNAGALGIVRTASFEGASALIASDPAVLDGIFVAEVHPWRPSVPGMLATKA